MKINYVWNAICSLLVLLYFNSFKDSVFKVYYETTIQRNRFYQPIKITICSPLFIFHNDCFVGRKLMKKFDTFNCSVLNRYPLECLTKSFKDLTASSIIQKIRECDQSFIFGKKLRLIKYKKDRKNEQDIEINQKIIKSYEQDYNHTYLNNGKFLFF